MSETYDPLAPLNIQLQGKDFVKALVPEGSHPMQILEAVAEPNKRGDNTNIHITSTLLNPTPTTKEGVVAQPGDRKFQTWSNVFQTEGQKEKDVDPLEEICKIFDACFGTTKETRPDLNSDTLNQLVGKQFVGVVKHEDDPQFGMQDRLVRYVGASAA